MPTVVLVSDMHGRLGDTRYLDAWRAWWTSLGFAVRCVFIDELLPELYELGAAMEAERLHAMLTLDDVVRRGGQHLVAQLNASHFDVVMGLSYGGYLAAIVHEQLGSEVTIVSVSATRLRHVLPLSVTPRVHAVFGADDPFVPPMQRMLAGGLMVSTVAGHGHDVYRHLDACAPHVLNALPLRYRRDLQARSAPALNTASPGVQP